jgi:hypothetical protein
LGQELKLSRTGLCARVQVSFDEYLQDRARVFRAMFPNESRSQRVGDVRNHHLTRTLLSISSASSPGETYRRFWVLQGEWRVQMLPLQFLLLTSCSCCTAPAGSTSESCV